MVHPFSGIHTISYLYFGCLCYSIILKISKSLTAARQHVDFQSSNTKGRVAIKAYNP